MNPNLLRRAYIHYMLFLVREAIQAKTQDIFELDKNIQFHTGTLDEVLKSKRSPIFDTVFVPYLLGVKNGLEKKDEIVRFIEQLIKLTPSGKILVSPSRSTKDFYIMGKRYFITPGYSNIQAISELRNYVIAEDRYWSRTQGLVVFGAQRF